MKRYAVGCRDFLCHVIVESQIGETDFLKDVLMVLLGGRNQLPFEEKIQTTKGIVNFVRAHLVRI